MNEGLGELRCRRHFLVKRIPKPPGLASDRKSDMIGQRRWLRLAAKIKGGRKKNGKNSDVEKH